MSVDASTGYDPSAQNIPDPTPVTSVPKDPQLISSLLTQQTAAQSAASAPAGPDSPGLVESLFSLAKGLGNFAASVPAGLVNAVVGDPVAHSDSNVLGQAWAKYQAGTQPYLDASGADVSHGISGMYQEALNVPIVGQTLEADAWAADKLSHAASAALLFDGNQAQQQGIWNYVSNQWDNTAGVSVGQAFLASPLVSPVTLINPAGILPGAPDLSNRGIFHDANVALNKVTENPTNFGLAGVGPAITNLGNTLYPFAKDGFDITDPKQRIDAFHANIFGMVGSGALDALWSWKTDPLNSVMGGLGTASRTARGIDQIAGDTSGITTIAGQIANKIPGLGKLTPDQLVETNGFQEAAQWISQQSNAATIQQRFPQLNWVAASFLAVAKTPQQVTDLARLGMGDVEAITRVKTEMADLVAGVTRTSYVSRTYEDLLTDAMKMQADDKWTPEDLATMQNTIKTGYDTAAAEVAAMQARHSDLASMMGVGNDAGAMVNSMQKFSPSRFGWIESVRDARATASAVRKLGDGAAVDIHEGNFISHVFQASALSAPVRFIAHAFDRIPDGVIDVNDPRSIQSLLIQMKNVSTPRGLALTDEDMLHLQGIVNGAQNPTDIQAALNLMQDEAVHRMAKNISRGAHMPETPIPGEARGGVGARPVDEPVGVPATSDAGAPIANANNPDAPYVATRHLVDQMLDTYKAQRDAAKVNIQIGSFGVHLVNGAEVGVVEPILRSQLLDHMITHDFQAVADHLHEKFWNPKSTWRTAAEKGWDPINSGLDTLMKAWRTTVLLRLGYIGRSQLDEQLRLGALTHMGAQQMYLGTGASNFVDNMAARVNRAGGVVSKALARRTGTYDELRVKFGLDDSIKTKSQFLGAADAHDYAAIENRGRAAALDHSRKVMFPDGFENPVKKADGTLDNADEPFSNANGASFAPEPTETDPNEWAPGVTSPTGIEIPKGAKQFEPLIPKLKAQTWAPNDEDVQKLRNLADAQEKTAAAIRDGVRQMDRQVAGKVKIKHSGESAYPLRDGTMVDGPFAGDGTGAKNRAFVTETALGEVRRDILGRASDEHLQAVSQRTDPRMSMSGTDPNHTDLWLRNLGQLKSDPVARMAIAGKSDEAIKKWMWGTSDGLAWMEESSLRSGNISERIGDVRHLVDSYVPPSKQIRDKLLNEGLDANDLVKAYPNPLTRPALHSPSITGSLNEASGNTIGTVTKGLVDKAFEYLGARPGETLSRGPGFGWAYRQSIQRQADIHYAQNGIMTGEDLQQYRAQASREATNFVRNYLYDGSHTSNLSNTIRTYFPFAAAWEDAMRAWSKITYDNPETLVRAGQLWNSPNVAGQGEPTKNGGHIGGGLITVVDKDGNVLPPNGGSANGSYILFNVPESFSKEVPDVLGVRDAMRALNVIRIPKGSFNTILEGNPVWLPGTGPLVAMPINFMARHAWIPDADNNAIVKYALPLGVRNSELDLISASVIRDAMKVIRGTEDPEFSRLSAGVLASLTLQAKRDGTAPPTQAEAIQAARMFWAFRTVQALIAPVQAGAVGEDQVYRNLYHQYQSTYGAQGPYKFLQDFPDYFDVAGISLSQNLARVPADVAADNVIRAHRDLADKLGAIDPGLIGMMATAGLAGYTYSKSESAWQQGQGITPGNNDTYRGSQSPAQAQTQISAQKGWLQYKDIAALVVSQLKARGLNTIQQKGAEDLAAFKTQWVNEQYQNNPAWYAEYKKFDNFQGTRIMEGLKQILSDPNYMADRGGTPTIQALKTYVQVRDTIISQLRQRKVDGGSDNLRAQSNDDLQQFVGWFTTKLRTADNSFDSVYTRYLERDDFSKNYGELGTGS